MNVIEEVNLELIRARRLHPKGFNSCHEGYAVIKEEFEELWDEIKKKKEDRDLVAMREECIQIAAMAVRFVEDLIKVKCNLKIEKLCYDTEGTF